MNTPSSKLPKADVMRLFKMEKEFEGKALQVVIAGAERDAIVVGKPAYDPQSLLPRTDS